MAPRRHASRWRCTSSATTGSAAGSPRRCRGPPSAASQVRLLYDFVGCRDTPAAFFQRMRGFGVHVVGYHKYRFWRPRLWSLMRRNHRKTLVCDGRLAFTGGINISIEWVSQAEGGGGWLDAAIAIEGPAVTPIEATFLRTWNRRAPQPDAPRPRGASRPRRPRAWSGAGGDLQRRAARPIRDPARGAARHPREPAARAGGEPLLRPRSGRRCARCGPRPRAASTCGSWCRWPAIPRILDLRDAGGLRAAAGGGGPHLPQPGRHPHQGAGRRRHVRLASAATTSTTARWPTTWSWWSTSSIRPAPPRWGPCWSPTWRPARS